MGNNYLNEMCRLCLCKRDNLLDIFCINENHGYIAAEVIQDLLQIEVGLLDGFPRCICSDCLDKLTDFKLFKKKCLESRSTFQQEFNAGDQQATWRKNQDTQVEQDPLAFSRPIKVETLCCESMEVPVEVEIAVKDEVDEAFSRPIKVEPSDSEMIEDPAEIAVKDEVDEQNCRQLRKAWDGIKIRRKRMPTEEARRRMGTGGGPCPSTSKSSIPELEVAIPSIDHYLLSIGDSDRLMEAPSGPEDFVVADGDLGGEDAAGSWSEPRQLEEKPMVEAVGSTAVVSGSASEPRQAVDTLQSPMGPGPSPHKPTDCVGGTRNITEPRALTRAEAHRRELDARLARIRAASADEAKMRQAAAEDEALLRQIRNQVALEQLEHQRTLYAMELEYKRYTYEEEEIVRAGENQAASHGSTTESMAMTLSEKLTPSPSASMDRFCASTKLEQEVEDGSGNAVHFHSLDGETTLSTTCFSIPTCVPVPASSISLWLGGRDVSGMDNSVTLKNSGESTSHYWHTIANNLLSQKSQECDLMEGKLGAQSNVMGMVNEISKGLESSVTVKNSGESTTHHQHTIVNNLLSQKSRECDLMEGKLGTKSNVMGLVNEISKGLDSKGEQVPGKEVERRRKSCSGGLEENKNNESRKRRSCVAGGSTPHACTICSKSFKTSDALQKHSRTHLGERCFLCSVCGKSFLWNCDLVLHMRRHAGERPHSCVVCSKSFAAVSDLNVHMRTHGGDRPYTCGVCSKSFTRKGVLDTHVLTHTGERPYSCRLCSKAFRRRSHLTIHFRTHTGEKPYSCSVCSKSFNESCSLKVHSRVHSKEKPYTCNVCSRSFSQSGSLNTHMRTHRAEKSYSCGMCSKLFSKSDELSAHMGVHSEGRPHACGVCSESFSVINQLQMHMSEHEGETRFSCRMCLKSFPSCKSLNMHMLIHEPENVYKCDHCSYAYSDKSALKKHILKCHIQDKS